MARLMGPKGQHVMNAPRIPATLDWQAVMSDVAVPAMLSKSLSANAVAHPILIPMPTVKQSMGSIKLSMLVLKKLNPIMARVATSMMSNPQRIICFNSVCVVRRAAIKLAINAVSAFIPNHSPYAVPLRCNCVIKTSGDKAQNK